MLAYWNSQSNFGHNSFSYCASSRMVYLVFLHHGRRQILEYASGKDKNYKLVRGKPWASLIAGAFCLHAIDVITPRLMISLIVIYSSRQRDAKIRLFSNYISITPFLYSISLHFSSHCFLFSELDYVFSSSLTTS